MSSLTEIFGEPISTYTVTDAVADGSMIKAPTDVTREVFGCPVVFTQAAWADLVAWDDSARAFQDETGRLWDVLMVSRIAARGSNAAAGSRVALAVYRVPLHTERGGRGPLSTEVEAEFVRFDMVIQAYDTTAGEPCITFMLPDED